MSQLHCLELLSCCDQSQTLSQSILKKITQPIKVSSIYFHNLLICNIISKSLFKGINLPVNAPYIIQHHLYIRCWAVFRCQLQVYSRIQYSYSVLITISRPALKIFLENIRWSLNTIDLLEQDSLHTPKLHR